MVLLVQQPTAVRLGAPASNGIRAGRNALSSRPRRPLVTRAIKEAPNLEQAVKSPASCPPSRRMTGPGRRNDRGPPPPPPLNEWPKQRSFTETVLGKVGDTLGDVSLITRRTLFPVANQLEEVSDATGGGPLQFESRCAKPVILVLGSGWAAHAFIKIIDDDAFDVIVVSPRNHFIFTPMLPSTAVGTVEFRSLLEPVRVSNPTVKYVEASCTKLDVDRKVATCVPAVQYPDGTQRPFEVRYDAVVVACGEESATFGIPGVAEHTCFLKEITDAVVLRNKIGQCFELASMPGQPLDRVKALLRFVVVGGGPTGVEFAGTLSDFLKKDLADKYPQLIKYVSVVLLQSGSSILTAFAAGLQGVAESALASSGVAVRKNVRVTRVNAGSAVIQPDGGGPDEVMEFGLCVWSAGNTARPVVRGISSAVPGQREFVPDPVKAPTLKLAVDPFLRVVGAESMLALGDNARMFGNPLPPTAQVAAQQGAYAARLLNRGYFLGTGGLSEPPPFRPTIPAELPPELLSGPLGPVAKAAEPALQSVSAAAGSEAAKPFDFLSLGIMAYVGDDSALTQLEAGDKVRVQLSGQWGFLLWRSVYITKQVSFRNRVLILFDWLKTRVFGRDLSQF